MKTKLVLTAFVSGLVFVGGLAASVITFPDGQEAYAADGSIAWQKEMAKAQAEAKSQSKFVFADVYTDWCGWCKRLDRDTFDNSDFANFAESKFVCVKVNAEDGAVNKKIAESAKVTGFPCGLVFNSDGKLIGKIGGYMKPDEYKDALQNVLDRYAKNPNVDALSEDE